MVAVPADTPSRSPVLLLIDAIIAVLLVQNPGLDASLNVIVEFTHTCGGPVIAKGIELIVTVAVAAQLPIL
jgi:hypothetical protein